MNVIDTFTSVSFFNFPSRKEGRTTPPPSRRRETRDRVTHSRWSSCDYLLSIGELTTNHRWGNRLPGRRNGTQSSNDFSPLAGLNTGIPTGHEFAPRRELMETRRGMRRALIKRNAPPSFPSRGRECVYLSIPRACVPRLRR